MPKRTRRTARTTASRNKRTRTKRTPAPGLQPPQRHGHRQWPWRPTRRRNERRDARHHGTLTRHLLRGAVYGLGSGVVGLLFWSLRFWMA
ncbi:hypothetical protein ACIGO6_39740 [Streptomyces sp. NPDC053750]|uniref:hypothetical protein n=1 Tax=Streptomyces sp. NPDC053750 TaxID=3365714 RepID=UPI0037D8D1C1